MAVEASPKIEPSTLFGSLERVRSRQSSHLTIIHPQCIFITYTSYATASDEHYRPCRYTDGGLVLARERVMDAEIWSCSWLSDVHTVQIAVEGARDAKNKRATRAQWQESG